MQGTEMNRNDEIRQLAYSFWQEEGCTHGHDVQDWLKAEAIWLKEHRPKGTRKQVKALKGRSTKQTQIAERAL